MEIDIIKFFKKIFLNKYHMRLLLFFILFSIFFSSVKTKKYTMHFSFYSKSSGLPEIVTSLTSLDDGENIPLNKVVMSNTLLLEISKKRWEYNNNEMYLWEIWEFDKGPVNFLQKLWFGEDLLKDIYIHQSIEKLSKKSIKSNSEIQSGIVHVSIEMKDKDLLHQISDYVINYVNDYYANINTLQGSENSKYIGIRLDQIKKDLDKSRNELSDFKSKNVDISSSPILQSKLQEMLYKLEVESQIYINLSAQFELKTLEKIDRSQTVFIVNSPYLDPKPTSPNYFTNFLLFSIISLMISFCYTLIKRK